MMRCTCLRGHAGHTGLRGTPVTQAFPALPPVRIAAFHRRIAIQAAADSCKSDVPSASAGSPSKKLTGQMGTVLRWR